MNSEADIECDSTYLGTLVTLHIMLLSPGFSFHISYWRIFV